MLKGFLPFPWFEKKWSWKFENKCFKIDSQKDKIYAFISNAWFIVLFFNEKVLNKKVIHKY